MTTRARIVLFAIVFEGAFVVIAAAIGVLVGLSPFELLRFRWRDAAWGAIATVPLLAGLGWCLSRDWAPFLRLRRTIDDKLVPLFSGWTIADIVVISIVAGIGEEVLFRGLIQPGLTAAVGPVVALLVTSVLFGLAHVVSATYAIVAGLIGAYLGWLLLVTGNLFIPIVVHALYDVGAIVHLSRRPPSARHDDLTQ